MHASLNRRQWLGRSASLTAGMSAAGWLSGVAAASASAPDRKRACILLWMAGGPSQTDTFDLKAGHANGGPFQEIATSVAGIQISEHLPQLAKEMKDLAILRSLQTKEGDHGRATTHLHTGYVPQGSIRFPTIGSLVSHELADAAADLPGFVAVSPNSAIAQPSVAAGFLGPSHAPLVVAGSGGEGEQRTLRVEDLKSSAIAPDRFQRRLQLLQEMEQPFLRSHPGPGTTGHVTAYDRAARLRRPQAEQAFNLTEESDRCRERYGRSTFGQGCLLARRLVERGVPFVEVTLGGWDTHDNNFEQVKNLCGPLDAGWSALLADLRERGLLESTLVVWMGEFGRTPGINPRNGRDHFPMAWSAVLGGGGIRGGQAIGRTSADGTTVDDRPIHVPDLMATIYSALGLDPRKQNMSNVSRPIRLADPAGEPIREVLA